jgi:hypothetical protein
MKTSSRRRVRLWTNTDTAASEVVARLKRKRRLRALMECRDVRTVSHPFRREASICTRSVAITTRTGYRLPDAFSRDVCRKLNPPREWESAAPPDWDAAPRRIKAADVFVSLASFPRDDTHRVLLKVWPRTALVFFSCSWCRLNAVTGAPGLLCGLPPCRPTSSRLRRS